MGKHRGIGDAAAGTDAGPAFDTLQPAEKAAEFDASLAEPLDYAQRNFDATAEVQPTRQGRQG